MIYHKLILNKIKSYVQKLNDTSQTNIEQGKKLCEKTE